MGERSGQPLRAIERSARGLSTTLQTSTVLTLRRLGPVAEWSIEFLEPECDGRYHNELLGLCYMIDAVRCFAGRSWALHAVMTTSAKGTAKAELEQILGAAVATGHSVPAIRFDWSLLSRERQSAPASGVPARPTSRPFQPKRMTWQASSR